MRDCRNLAKGYQGFEIAAIMKMLTSLPDGNTIDSDVTLTDLGGEEFLDTPVMSVNSISFPEAEVNLPRTLRLISRSMYISL